MLFYFGDVFTYLRESSEHRIRTLEKHTSLQADLDEYAWEVLTGLIDASK